MEDEYIHEAVRTAWAGGCYEVLGSLVYIRGWIVARGYVRWIKWEIGHVVDIWLSEKRE